MPYQQLISSNPVYLQLAALSTEQKFRSRLSQRYDLLQEFTDTKVYSPTSAYNAADRVYLDAPAYSQTSAYPLGTLTLFQSQVYANSTAVGSGGEVWNPAQWTLLGNQYDMFYALTPFPVFDISKGWYNVGDHVFWKNHTYTALQQSVCLSHEEKLQYYRVGKVPFQNVFPDDPLNGPIWWKDNGQFIIPAGNLLTQNPATYTQFTAFRADVFLTGGSQLPAGGTVYNDPTLAGWVFSIERKPTGTMVPGVDYSLITNAAGLTIGWQLIKPGDKFGNPELFIEHFEPIISQQNPLNPFASLTSQQIIATYFAAGDNRNQEVLEHYINMVLYYLFARLVPKHIPETRDQNNKMAQLWLKEAMQGDIIPGLVAVQPPQGLRTRWGSNVKNENSY